MKKKGRRFTHLTPIERGRIAEMYRQGMSFSAMGKALGRSSSTVWLEIQRGTVTQRKRDYQEVEVYIPDTAQYRYEENRKRCRRSLKCDSKEYEPFLSYVEEEVLRKKQGIDGVIGRARKLELFPREKMVCTTTFYSYVEKKKVKVRNIDLPLRVRYRKKKVWKQPIHKRLYGTSIEKRTEEVNERLVFGHWEIDLMIGRQSKRDNVLLTLTERKTRKEYIEKVKNKKVTSVMKAIERIFKRVGDYKKVFQSITSDNGVEFSSLYKLEEKYNIQVFYAHPYASFERGSNERNNGFIRYQIPKKKWIRSYTRKRIQEIEDWINNKPRRMFGYRTAEELYQEELQHSS